MDSRKTILSRMFILLGLLLIVPVALSYQLVRLNFFNGDELRALWSKQAIDSLPIYAQRGNIYDANGTLLATNTANYKVAIDPKVDNLTQQDISRLNSTLAKITGQPASYFQSKINRAPKNSRYIVLANHLDVVNRDEISSLDINGVIIEKSFKRIYTFGSLASHTLGFVNYNLDGRIGLESYYNNALKGQDGVQQVRRDALGNISAYVGAPKRLPVNGQSLHTTIDSYIQAILEDELQRGVIKAKAISGTGIIIDPKTGAIKAMANYPTYNPNNPGNTEDINRRNFAISNMIEPGSTFKLVTAIAAVEQKVVDFNEIFETPDDGTIEIHGLKLRDHDPLGNMDFKDVIKKSSNVAIAEIAMRMDNDKFYQYARNMGFGSTTQLDISGEVNGVLKKPYDWSLVSLPWMAHGYEVLATPIQIAQAYAAFANDGIMMKPYLVDYIEDGNGKIIHRTKPTKIRSVAKKSTIDKLIPIFEEVVSDSGTGHTAQIEGLRIAGKTGTAKKVVNGRYSNNYLASFVGLYPVENPRYVTLIILDEPKTSGYGGVVSAPIFKEVTKRIAGLDNEIQKNISIPDDELGPLVFAPYLIGLEKKQAEKILSEMDIPYRINGDGDTIMAQNIDAETPIDKNQVLELSLTRYDVDADDELVEIPDLRGMNMRAANNLLMDLGIKTELIGSGTIYAQFPLAGDKIRTTTTVVLRGKSKSMELLTQTGI